MNSGPPAIGEINRRAHALVDECLTDTPVVIVEGARQVGKSTLAKQVVSARGGRILTLDDEDLLAAARFDPSAFVTTHERKASWLSTRYSLRRNCYAQ